MSEDSGYASTEVDTADPSDPQIDHMEVDRTAPRDTECTPDNTRTPAGAEALEDHMEVEASTSLVPQTNAANPTDSQIVEPSGDQARDAPQAN